MFTLATLPSTSDFMAAIGAWSSPIFSDLTPFAEYAIGITLGLGLIAFLILIVSRAMGHHTA